MLVEDVYAVAGGADLWGMLTNPLGLSGGVGVGLSTRLESDDNTGYSENRILPMELSAA